MEGRKMSKSSIASLAKAISSKKGLTVAEAERFITKMFDVAKEGIQEDKQLKVRWLGGFKVTTIKDRESVDVNTGDRIVIEGRDKISFTPDNILKEIVNKPFAQFETVVVNDGIDFSDIDEKFARMENGVEEEEASVEEAPVDDSPVEETPVEEAPVDDSPVEETPVDDSPVEEFPVEKAPVEDMSQVKEVSTEESLVKESSMEEPIAEPQSAVPVDPQPTVSVETETEDVQEVGNRHFVIPKYLVAIVAVVFVLLMGATFWFAFNYGKMQAQRDSLESQLAMAKKQAKASPVKKAVKKVEVDSAQLVMQEKAREDSIRMAQSSNAIKIAEESENKENQKSSQEGSSNNSTKNLETSNNSTKSQDAQLHYNNDVRVRTGAYRIVGVDKTITVKAGQTMTSLSKRYLGEGMECYIEALNGCKVVKEGQKLKIPKLALKKKK